MPEAKRGVGVGLPRTQDLGGDERRSMKARASFPHSGAFRARTFPVSSRRPSPVLPLVPFSVACIAAEPPRPGSWSGDCASAGPADWLASGGAVPSCAAAGGPCHRVSRPVVAFCPVFRVSGGGMAPAGSSFSIIAQALGSKHNCRKPKVAGAPRMLAISRIAVVCFGGKDANASQNGQASRREMDIQQVDHNTRPGRGHRAEETGRSDRACGRSRFEGRVPRRFTMGGSNCAKLVGLQASPKPNRPRPARTTAVTCSKACSANCRWSSGGPGWSWAGLAGRQPGEHWTHIDVLLGKATSGKRSVGGCN